MVSEKEKIFPFGKKDFSLPSFAKATEDRLVEMTIVSEQ
jgi:hypothetical protein